MKHTRSDLRNEKLISAALLLLYFPAVGRYGLKTLLFLTGTLLIGFVMEYGLSRIRKELTFTPGFIYWILFPLIIPSGLPLWMGWTAFVFGSLVSVIFFGGFGRHPVSPPTVSWAFATLSFSAAYNMGWSYPFPGAFDGFSRWSGGLPTVEVPIRFLLEKQGELSVAILTGRFPQIPGNTLPLLVITVGLLLLLFKAIDYRSCLSFFSIYLVLNFLFHWFAPDSVYPVRSLLIGELLLAGFILLPDHRVQGRTYSGRWISGGIAAVSAFLIRYYSAFPDGAFFAVLMASIFTPIVDELVIKFSAKVTRYEQRD